MRSKKLITEYITYIQERQEDTNTRKETLTDFLIKFIQANRKQLDAIGGTMYDFQVRRDKKYPCDYMNGDIIDKKEKDMHRKRRSRKKIKKKKQIYKAISLFE